jgi:hypothetical protein
MDPVTAFLQAHPWVGVVSGAIVGWPLLQHLLWPLLQHLNARRAHDLNAAKVIADLQKELGDKLVRLIDLSKQYATLRDAEALSGRTREHWDRPNEMRRLQAQIDLLGADILAAEGRLAKLENRPPRPIQVKWIPPSAPTGFRFIDR